jgi:hypothetical protein
VRSAPSLSEWETRAHLASSFNNGLPAQSYAFSWRHWRALLPLTPRETPPYLADQ